MTWTVYGLIDPRNGHVFYVGYSAKVSKRAADHGNDPASSAWRRCREIREQGHKVATCIFADQLSKHDARIIEARLILSIPDLDNSKSCHIMPYSAIVPNWMDLSGEVAMAK